MTLRRFLCGALAALAGCALPAHAQLTLRVAVPAGTPQGARVFVAGSFNGWAPADTAFALVPTATGAWAITLPDSIRGPVEYKFTLGSWDRAETDTAGGDVPNRSTIVPRAGAVLVNATVARWRDGTPRRAKPSTRRASVHVISDSFAMPQLARVRRAWIYLPPGYDSSAQRYPVLYMHDGQNVFDDSTSYAGEWGVDETLDSLHARGHRGVIVVAMDHGDAHRLDEYDPWKNPNPRLGGGEGDAYVDFLVRTFKPYVDAHYRTLADPGHTAILGSSMGGLISLYAALKYPQVFGKAGVFSCACWIAKPAVFDYARKAAAGSRTSRFYFVAGDLETADREPVLDQARMVETLIGAGMPAANIRALTAPDGRHAEWFWRREFPAAVEWLFPDR